MITKGNSPRRHLHPLKKVYPSRPQVIKRNCRQFKKRRKENIKLSREFKKRRRKETLNFYHHFDMPICLIWESSPYKRIAMRWEVGLAIGV
jgi:hypothetical protein